MSEPINWENRLSKSLKLAKGNEIGRVIGYQAHDEFIDQIKGLGKY